MKLPDWVLDKITTLPDNYTGKIELNCVEGGVGNMNTGQSHRPPREVKPTRFQPAIPR